MRIRTIVALGVFVSFFLICAQTTCAQPADVAKAIKAKAAEEWPNDYQMQAYQIKNEIAAYDVVRSYEKQLSSDAGKRIVAKAIREWPNEYQMQAYQIKNEVAAARGLGLDNLEGDDSTNNKVHASKEGKDKTEVADEIRKARDEIKELKRLVSVLGEKNGELQKENSHLRERLNELERNSKINSTYRQVRSWESADSRFSTVGTLVSYEKGVVKLRKADGQVVELPARKLSESDRKFLEDYETAKNSQ